MQESAGVKMNTNDAKIRVRSREFAADFL